MKIIYKGLKDYPNSKKTLIKVSKLLSQIANSKQSHLGDIIGVIKTSITILEIECNFISQEFKKQKSPENKP